MQIRHVFAAFIRTLASTLSTPAPRPLAVGGTNTASGTVFGFTDQLGSFRLTSLTLTSTHAATARDLHATPSAGTPPRPSS